MIRILKHHLVLLLITMKTNPLNYFNIRKLDVPTKNLEYIEIPMSYNLEEAIDKWVYQNCKNRYFLGKTYNKKEITVFGGKQLRPNIHINDMVNAYDTLIKSENSKI